MKSSTTDAIREMTLKARKLLVDEISEQLEGIYGLPPDGRFKPSGEYPVLQQSKEAATTRAVIETLLTEEKAAGLDGKAAREKLIKEAAFTWLNRCVAFKMLESRKLLRATISKGQDSNGFKMWLTEPGNESHLKAYEAGDLPLDGLGEGPRQRAYRQFLLAQCARLAEEVNVLFDPRNIASRLCPRPHAIKALIELLGANELTEAWIAGNEETIGWVYQAFNEPDLEIFRGESAMKVPRELMAAKTQKFTPRWIVKYLVENTLGRTWVDMHPDSKIADSLEYIVPRAVERQAPLKPAGQITLLDPACGTMHFGLVAFDLFVEMYREELARAGQPGWPDTPSVTSEADIPAAILSNNLYGIDIDLRAVQLSALTIYLKAKTLNPGTKLTESRLACADIHTMGGNRLEQFLKTSHLDERPIYGRVLQALQQRLKDADQLGSLLRLEEEIRDLIEKERKRYEKEGRQLDFFGWAKEQFETEAGKRGFWEILEIQIGQALDAYAREEAESGRGQSFFVGETIKGLRLLEIMSQRYDIVVANPPYIDSRDMNAELKRFIDTEYKDGKRNLYAAFTLRCLELVRESGLLGIITGQTFMFISTYERFRKQLIDAGKIESLAQYDYGLFAGVRVDTAAFVLRRESDERARKESEGIYFRLVKEPDAESKRNRFEQALTKLHIDQTDPITYRYRQADLDTIPGSPWVYWMPEGVKRIFETLPPLGQIAEPRQGMATADNRRFLRYWWEVGESAIAFSCVSREESEARHERWYPYMKGGSAQRWYGNQEYVVNYGRNGYELKAWAAPLYGNSGWSRIIKSTDYYFKPGVTWTDVTSGRFSARLSPGGFVFDVSGSCAFPTNISFILGVINSSFSYYMLNLINPTVHVQVGDLRRLPIPNQQSERLAQYVDKAIAHARKASEENETTFGFICPSPWESGIDDVAQSNAELSQIEQYIDDEVFQLYDVSNRDRALIEAELDELPVENEEDEEFEVEVDSSETDAAEQTEFALTRDELARRWISYAVGIVLGRFQPGVEEGLGRGEFSADIATKLHDLVDADGVMVLDPGHPDNLAARVLEALQIMLGESEYRAVVAEVTGRDADPEEELRRYFSGTFFKEHIKLYRKRPVYWLLQSSRKKYGVWVFHEKLTKDSLHLIRGEKYVGSKVKLLENEIQELTHRRDAAAGKARRDIEKQMDELEEALEDVREFAALIDRITQRGYTPHIDDGVLIKMAPLWELISSWQAEPKKCWKALQNGDYDWSHTAMDYRPDQVREKCKTNKSFAIAHGLENVYVGE